MSHQTREDVFEEWMSVLRAVGFAHGQKLFDMLLDYAQGRFFLDSSDADALLRKAEEQGRIRRAKNAAGGYTREFKPIQRFAGVGGLAPAQIEKHATFPHLYGWEPVPEQVAKK